MNVLQEKRPFQERDAISSLETVDVATGQCTVLKEFDHLIEAPNWLPTGDRLLYNAGGRLWLFDLATGESRQIDTGFACRCNNDHVLSPDGRSVGLSQGTAEDGWSRVYTVPLEGGRAPADHPHRAQLLARLVSRWKDLGLLCGAQRRV